MSHAADIIEGYTGWESDEAPAHVLADPEALFKELGVELDSDLSFAIARAHEAGVDATRLGRPSLSGLEAAAAPAAAERAPSLDL